MLSEASIALLCQRFNLAVEFAEELQDTLVAIDRQIERRQQIIQAVLAELDNDLNSETVVHLFQHLFGPVPIPAAALDCVCTEMQIFFSIRYRQGRLYDAPAETAQEQGHDADTSSQLWDSLSQTDRDTIQTFLLSLEQASLDFFRRFPSFGPCDPKRIDLDWCDRIAQRTGISRSEILQMLSQSVGVFPTHKGESYLVHDIWGHHWQLFFTQFQSDYTILTTCDEPLRARETAYTLYGPLSCGEIFCLSGEHVELDIEKAHLFFHGEVQQRLGLLFALLIGEMVADMAEFKFILDYPHSADQLLSSSLFKHEATKFDLSLHDIDRMFLRILQPLLEVRLSVFEDSRLETDLLSEWAAAGQPVESLELRTSLKQAIAQLYQIFLADYNSSYLPTLTGEVGLFTQIVSNLLYLQNAVNSLYTNINSDANDNLPYRDLLIIFIGCYCSSDSYTDFWDIDDTLAGYFLPCWQILAELIRRS